MAESGFDYPPPIFVLGFHRGGTTFVQRLLNCHEDVTIWGENGGIISDLRVMYERYSQSPASKVDIDKYQDFSEFYDRFAPWANPFDADQFALQMGNFLESLFRTSTDSNRVWGFKEIRHETLDDINFIFRIFPKCRLVLLIRNPKDVVLSTYFAKWGGKHFSGSTEKVVQNILTSYANTIETFLDISDQKSSLARILRIESINYDTVYSDIFDFLELSRSGVNRQLLIGAMDARVGSSYSDYGRIFDNKERQLMQSSLGKMVESVLPNIASNRTLSAIQSWYPSLLLGPRL